MKKLISYFLIGFAFAAASCVSDEDPVRLVSVELSQLDTIRQVMAFGDNEVRVKINVNGGDTQVLTFSDLPSSEVTTVLNGIRIGQQNEITLRWFEVLNGFEVELSDQRQSFVATGNTQLNSPHRYTRYDYDNDGISNYDERIAGTCVWSSASNCVRDIPSDNAIQNGDFSNGDTNWFHTGIDRNISNGEYCVATLEEYVLPQDAALGYVQELFVESGTNYRLVADVRSDVAAEIYAVFLTPAPEYRTVLQEPVTVSAGTQTISVTMENRDDSPANLSLYLANGANNWLCFDNVRLIRE